MKRCSEEHCAIVNLIGKGGHIRGVMASRNPCLARGQVVCRGTVLARLAPHELRRSCGKLCHSAGGELQQFSSCSDMFLCKLPSVISGANSALGLPTITSVSNHTGQLPQSKVSPANQPGERKLRRTWRRSDCRTRQSAQFRGSSLKKR